MCEGKKLVYVNMGRLGSRTLRLRINKVNFRKQLSKEVFSWF